MNAIAFDAYGTFFDVYSVTALCEELFPGQGTQVALSWRAKQLQYTFLRSLMGRYINFWTLTTDALVYVCKAMSLDLTPAKRDQLMQAYLTLAAFPDVKPGLEALKKSGMRLAILSNGEPKMLAAVAQHAGIDQLLDAIISVDEVRIYKPSPSVYQLAASHLKTTTREVGFVSSNSWDINGAGSAGLKTFWIQRNAAEPSEELGYPPSAIVHTITDLAALVTHS
jgi:2-haloacid dehalogenase